MAVAGIAMGLASNDDMSKWEVITDLQDLEDGKGAMDFKMTGTADGLTAIQLDTKTTGLSDEIIEKKYLVAQFCLGDKSTLRTEKTFMDKEYLVSILEGMKNGKQ